MLKFVKRLTVVILTAMIVTAVIVLFPQKKEYPPMSYGVLLNSITHNNVYSIEFHDEEGYMLVILQGVTGFKDDKNNEYKVEINDASYVRSLADENGVVLIESEDTKKEKSFFEEVTSLVKIFIGGLGVVLIFFVVICFSLKLIMNAFSAGEEKLATTGSNGKLVETEEAQKVGVRFSDIAGLDEEIDELKEVVDFLKNPETYERLGAKIPKGILLYGKPGTGKTLIAKAVAGEAEVPFISASGSEFVDRYVGVGAENIRKLFKKAKENAPCIVFIDEIDSIGNRNDESSENSQTINQLLTELDGFEKSQDIIVLAATNMLDKIDPALRRPGRFDRIINIGLPDVRAREEILKIHARNKPLYEDVNLKEIARTTAGFSGAQLENLLNEAALITARKKQEAISKENLDEAFTKVTVGLKKVGKVISDKEKEITANHEAGHTIVSMCLPTQGNVKEVSIIQRGDAGGYTMHDQDEDKNYLSKKELTERLTVLMAGRVAEEIFIGDISTGALQDIEIATKIASSMISTYGMGTAVGAISVKNVIDGDVQLLSNKKLDDIGDEIVELIKKAEEQARKIILEHNEMHQELVKMLLEQETLTSKELKILQKKYNLVANT